VNSLRAYKAFLIFSALLAGAAAAAGCGGSSSRTAGDDDPAGAGGDAGSGAQGGSSNGGTGVGGSSVGGSNVGGSSVGGSSVGGSSVGGMETGGSSTGGMSTGGMSTGGMSTGGVAGTSGGAAGAGGVCSLPIVSGNCNAYFQGFGFSTTDGNCQPFVYGGCGGNDNRFGTLAECEATCGGSLSVCPPRAPHRLDCSAEGRVCTYDLENCLCAPTITGLCSKLDSTCTLFDGGVSPIIGAGWQKCSCTNGAWVCELGG
jgi:hypothetical protein